MKAMRKVIYIEMANDNDLYEVSTGGTLTLRKNTEEDFEILLDGEVIDEAYNQKDAETCLLSHAIDNDLIIQGYGRYSGRKFWQLPDALQKEILQRIN